MRDPYLYEDEPVLKNLLGIRNADDLERAEADITSVRWSILGIQISYLYLRGCNTARVVI
jgi:fido (protein-threonine AMPylation protein)